MFSSKKDTVFIILACFFVTNAIVAELIGGKLIQIGPFTMSIGILPWPIVFLTTDLINEYFGKSGVRKLTIITVFLIIYAFIVLYIGMQVKATSFSPVNDDNFRSVFGQSMWIIVGSIIAFLISQLVDVFIFWFLRDKTGGKHLWLRSTGSTVISQLIDTFVVLGIAFWLPGKINGTQFLNLALTGYTCKLIIAVLLTPVIYALHYSIGKYIRK
jgi:uncharacterized integral membrane protein (TIGR00697 family)